MREIKFRAWEKDLKEMHKINLIDFKGEEVVDENGDIHEFTDIVLMQFTGLYDKNKVPIYEGDILNFDDEYWVISFEYGKFIATFDNVCEDLHEVSHYEVIGNIHENSNLIGDVNGN